MSIRSLLACSEFKQHSYRNSRCLTSPSTTSTAMDTKTGSWIKKRPLSAHYSMAPTVTACGLHALALHLRSSENRTIVGTRPAPLSRAEQQVEEQQVSALSSWSSSPEHFYIESEAIVRAGAALSHHWRTPELLSACAWLGRGCDELAREEPTPCRPAQSEVRLDLRGPTRSGR